MEPANYRGGGQQVCRLRCAALRDVGVNFYPHHIGDYLSGTSHLTWTEDCAYRRLLDAYYTRESPLPGDIAACCRLVRAASKDERKAVETVLTEFFHLSAEGWRHSRCDAEIVKASLKRTKAAESANKRWQSERNANAYANALPAHSEGNAPNPNPNPRRDSAPDALGVVAVPSGERKRPRKAAEVPLPEGFALSDAVRQWAAKHEFGQLELHFEHFVGVAKAKGYTYADWDQALMNAIRADWARVREPKRMNGAAIVLPTAATPDEAVIRRISERNGGQSVVRLSDGRLQCGVHYYRPDGQPEVAL